MRIKSSKRDVSVQNMLTAKTGLSAEVTNERFKGLITGNLLPTIVSLAQNFTRVGTTCSQPR